jgi:hypothetical protein
MENFKRRTMVLFGAAMYLKEKPLIFEVMDLAFSVDENKIDEQRIIELEEYLSSQIALKIDAKEIAKLTLDTDLN